MADRSLFGAPLDLLPGPWAPLAEVACPGMDAVGREALRTFAQAHPCGPEAWLAGLGHPRIGPALRLIHREPARALQPSQLARAAGLSRSSFFLSFAQVAGEAPAAYLTRWRVHLAASWLRHCEDGLDAIAEEVGFFDASALTKAFRRVTGVNPGEYRRNQRQLAGVGCPAVQKWAVDHARSNPGEGRRDNG